MTPEGSLVVGQSVRMTCDVKATNNIPTVSWLVQQRSEIKVPK